eukprot:Gb_26416 [translate_table: standard]
MKLTYWNWAIQTLAGMGAKVQCENYFPVIFPNKNAKANSIRKVSLAEPWPHCTEEIILKESELYSNLKQGTMGKCSEKDKELLKYTMLKHEEIFREQVCEYLEVRELHRLYQIQKLLMAEFKRKDSNTSTLSSGTAQDGLFPIHVGSESVKSEGKSNLWGILSGTITKIDRRDHGQPISGMDYRETSRCGLFEQNLQMGLTQQKVECIPRGLYSLQPSRAARRKFDLERPADEYIDEETSDQNEETVSGKAVEDNLKEPRSSNYQFNVEPESELKLTLKTGCEKGAKENGRQTGTCIQPSFPEQRREDVKEPKHPRCREEAVFFTAAFTRSEASTQETSGKQMSVVSNQSFCGGPYKYGHEYQKNEDCRSRWQISGVEHEGSRKENQIDLESGERSTQENSTYPHWFLQKMVLFVGQRSVRRHQVSRMGLLGNLQFPATLKDIFIPFVVGIVVKMWVPGLEPTVATGVVLDSFGCHVIHCQDTRTSVKKSLGNSSSQGFIWQHPSALFQQRMESSDAAKQLSLGEHEVRPIFFQDQRGTGCSLSKEGIFTGMVTPQRNPVFSLVSSKGLPIDITSAPVTVSPHGASLGLISNPHGEIYPSGLWSKSEDSSRHLPLGVHSQNYPTVPADIDLQMQNFDSQFSFHAQPLLSGSIGMNVKQQSSEVSMRNLYQGGSPVQPAQHGLPSIFLAGSPSIFGQTLCQAGTAVGSKSIPRQGAACEMSVLTPSLSTFSSSSLPECSKSLSTASFIGMAPAQVLRGQSIVDNKVEKEIDLTLGLSSRATEEARKNSPYYSHAINGIDDACQNSAGQVDAINESIHQESEQMDKDTQSGECITRTFIDLPYIREAESNSLKNIVLKQGIGFSDFLKSFPEGVSYRGVVDDKVLPRHLVNNPGERGFPPWKDNITLVSDLWKDHGNIDGKKGTKPDEPGVGKNGAFKLESLLGFEQPSGHSTPVQETVQNDEFITHPNNTNRHADLQTATELAEHEMKMETSKGNSNAAFGPHKEEGIAVNCSGQICVKENKHASPNAFQQTVAAADINMATNLQEETSEVLDFKAKGIKEKVSKQMEMEARHAQNSCERNERGLGFHFFDTILEPMSTKGVFEDEQSLAKFSLQVPISDRSPGVEVPSEDSIKTPSVFNHGERNKKGSEEASCQLCPGRVKILQKDVVGRDICAEQVDSTEISSETVKANVQLSEYEVNLEKCSQCTNVQTRSKHNIELELNTVQMKVVEEPSCSSQLLENARTVSCASRDLPNDTDLAADILLGLASAKSSRTLHVDSCQVQIPVGVKRQLDWFADIVVYNADCLESTTTGYREEVDNSFSSLENGSAAQEPELSENSIPKEKACSPLASNGLDFFESMTLMLKESSVDGDCKSLAKQQDETERLPSPVDHNLRPSKRGKRRRDFQREVLPSISSLSRQEVTEDMQFIGGLIRSTGEVWHTGSTRRSSGKFSSRDDWLVPLTGRRSRYMSGFRANSGCLTTNFNIQQAGSQEQEVENLNAFSWTNAWGETIRRRRMQRPRAPVSSLALNPA